MLTLEGNRLRTSQGLQKGMDHMTYVDFLDTGSRGQALKVVRMENGGGSHCARKLCAR